MPNFFQQRRTELGLTQRQIANAFEPQITSSTVSTWENEIATPSKDLVEQGARIYCVSIPEFLEAIYLTDKAVRARKAAHEPTAAA